MSSLRLTTGEKLDPEVKKIWLEALESGEYKQGKGELRTAVKHPDTNEPTGEYEYCCLGVLCDVLSKKRGKGGWVDPESGYFRYSGGEAASFPPSNLAREVGLQPGGALEGREAMSMLAVRNDGELISGFARRHFKGWTFERIAAWVDKNL